MSIMKIPKIIHQVYEDLSGPPETLQKISSSWRRLNPEWEYRFWNKNDIDAFLKEYYPDFISTYYAFQYPVQRWDSIRYLILYKVGGLYVDMDYECIESVETILADVECAMGLEPEGHARNYQMPYIVGNAFMAAIPGHPYFEELIHSIFNSFFHKYDSTNSAWRLILETTGPFLTTRIYKDSKYKDCIKLLPADLVAPLTQSEVMDVMNGKATEEMMEKVEKSVAIHYFFSTWTV